MIYNYRAKNKQGQTIEGAIEAPAREEAIVRLSEEGILLLSIEKEQSKNLANINISFLNRIKNKDLVMFSRQLAVMASATLPIVRSLRILSEQTENLKLKEIILNIADDVDGGEKLSNSMERHPKAFSEFFVAMVRSGETSGNLDKVLNYLADEQEKDYALMSKIKGAMIYPAFILTALGGVGIVMMVFVVPKMTSILQETGGQLPMATKILIGVSGFLSSWQGGGSLAIAIPLIIVGIKVILKRDKPKQKFDFLKLKLPIFGGLFQRIYLVRFTRSLSTLVEGGVPLPRSLAIVADVVGNAYYRNLIQTTVKEVEDGNPIAGTFLKTKEVPSMISHMLAVGEKTGRIAEVLNKMTEFYTKEIESMVANLISLIEPLIMILMGLAVGLMVAAVIMPMYNMASGF
ncbi:MAG: type II secretion system F family protein [Candidatus Kuenenbacteria bacterium]